MVTMVLGGLWHGAAGRSSCGAASTAAARRWAWPSGTVAERRDTDRREALGLRTTAVEEREILRRMARLNRGLPDSMSRDAQVSVLPRVETRLRHRQEARSSGRCDRSPPHLARPPRDVPLRVPGVDLLPGRIGRPGARDPGRLLTGWSFSAPLVDPLLLFVIAASLAAQYVPRITMDGLRARFSLLRPALQAIAVALAILVIDVLGPQGVAPFIYFQF